ncbi:MAG: hypothetical protein GY823_05490 [Flavobacteriaceae bacterium]|nr:hypothetical protein [Flavobacteriaceae bacterium]
MKEVFGDYEVKIDKLQDELKEKDRMSIEFKRILNRNEILIKEKNDLENRKNTKNYNGNEIQALKVRVLDLQKENLQLKSNNDILEYRTNTTEK